MEKFQSFQKKKKSECYENSNTVLSVPNLEQREDFYRKISIQG